MSQALLFIVFRGLEIQKKVEENSNEKHLNLEPIPSHKGSVTWFLFLAPPKSIPTLLEEGQTHLTMEAKTQD